MSDNPELLAPAGNIACALAALEAGADAVYLGLKKFSARDRSENFDASDLARITTLTRRKNKKVYVALNTLIRDEELSDAARLAADAAECGADALIVQDIGLVRLLREYFPFLKIHASTQMGIHNSAGLEQASAMGISRVILERQVTREELALMAPKSPVELEIFVHGALCLSLSGRCLLSSSLGGDSGNRGRCSQPCRRLYRRQKGGNLTGREGLFLSPGDLSLADDIPLIKRIGITSLKIEGRLRREDYVESTVRGWRILLDGDGSESALSEARKQFARVPGRTMTEGFSTTESIKTLVSPDEPATQGRPVGLVGRVIPGGFFLTGQTIRSGDKLRINPPGEGDPILLTALGIERRKEGLWIPCTKPVVSGSRVSLIGYAASGFSERAGNLPVEPLPAPLSLELALDGKTFSVRACFGDASIERVYPANLEPADNRAVTGEDLEAMFRATATAHLSVAGIHVTVVGRWFFPAAELKRLRREFYRELEGMIPADWAARRSLGIMALFDRRSTVERPIPADNGASSDEVILPPFVPETELPGFREKRTGGAAGSKNYRITSLFQIPVLSGISGVILKGGFPLPVCNSMAEQECRAWGLTGYQAWPEWDRGLLAGGDFSVMATRVPLTPGVIEDSRGRRFRIVREKDSPVTLLYPGE
jgi:putative protease